jgi:hypothetical protein
VSCLRGLRLATIHLENAMSASTSLAAVTTLALVTACASPGAPTGNYPPKTAQTGEHAGHQPGAAANASKPSMAMREMHDKMMNAKTPAERQALMAEHMKSMQDGMAMMKGMGGMGAMGAGMGGGMGMSAEMTKHHQQMMEGRMEMMQMMMEMMLQRLPPTAPTQ